MRTTTIEERTWWARPGLEVRDGRMAIAGRDAETLAREQGTPLYAYDLVRVEEQARALEDAFAGAGLRGLGAAGAEGPARAGAAPVPA